MDSNPVTYADQRSTDLIANKAFSKWPEAFPNASSVVALIARLADRVEIITIEGESYRFKEARERAAREARFLKSPRSRDPRP